MKRYYVVEMWEGQYWVVYKEAGHKKFVEPFGQDYFNASLSAYLGNKKIADAEFEFAGGVR